MKCSVLLTMQKFNISDYQLIKLDMKNFVESNSFLKFLDNLGGSMGNDDHHRGPDHAVPA